MPCPITCVTGTPPADRGDCNYILEGFDVARIILMACNLEPLTLGTTDKDGNVILPVSTPAAICAAMNVAAGDTPPTIFVTPPVQDYTIADPSFTAADMGCGNSLQIEGERTLTFSSRNAWYGTGVAGATAPVWANATFWEQIKYSDKWVAYGVLLCNGDIVPFFKNGQFARPQITVFESFETIGATTFRIAKGTVVFGKGYDDFTQPQINVISCGGVVSTWL